MAIDTPKLKDHVEIIIKVVILIPIVTSLSIGMTLELQLPNAEDHHDKSTTSELETQKTIKNFTSQSPIAGAIDWCSYSELVLHLWDDTTSDVLYETFDNLEMMYLKKLSLIVEKFKLPKICRPLPKTGSIDNFFYGSNESYEFIIEFSLNENATNGFVLSPSEIAPAGKDLLLGVIFFI